MPIWRSGKLATERGRKTPQHLGKQAAGRAMAGASYLLHIASVVAIPFGQTSHCRAELDERPQPTAFATFHVHRWNLPTACVRVRKQPRRMYRKPLLFPRNANALLLIDDACDDLVSGKVFREQGETTLQDPSETITISPNRGPSANSKAFAVRGKHKGIH